MAYRDSAGIRRILTRKLTAWHRIRTRWSRFSGIGLSGAKRGPCALQARLPHPSRGPAAGIVGPSAASRKGRADPRGASQCALSGLGGSRDARFAGGDQSGRHPRIERRTDLRRRAGEGRGDDRESGRSRGRLHGARLGDRRRRELAFALRPRQGCRRKGGAGSAAIGHHHAPVDRVRARGSSLPTALLRWRGWPRRCR